VTQKTSSILFGNEMPRTRSITRSDFVPKNYSKPEAIIPSIDYSVIVPSIEEDEMQKAGPALSIMKSSYVPLPPAAAETMALSSSTKKYLTGHHFKFGNDDRDLTRSLTKEHFVSPSHEVIASHKLAPRSKELSFESTLEKTVSR
jgi:hypothetical protein